MVKKAAAIVEYYSAPEYNSRPILISLLPHAVAAVPNVRKESASRNIAFGPPLDSMTAVHSVKLPLDSRLFIFSCYNIADAATAAERCSAPNSRLWTFPPLLANFSMVVHP